MTIELLRDFFLWCMIFNAGTLTTWLIVFLLAKDWIYRMHSKWFAIPRERFDAIHYAGMAFFKTSIFVFNAVPYFALLIVGG